MTLSRCEHGIYLPSWAKDGANPYCTGCTNFGKVPAAKDVVLPRSSSNPLSTDGRVMANPHSTGCPDCGSSVYLRAKETDGDTNRECGECGRKYRAKLSVHQQAQQLLAELQEEML